VRLDFAQFHGLIHAVDECVGKILKTLEAEGLAEDTWVIFTTDHGIAFPRAKSTLYDPGIKTALIMRWPRGFAGSKVYKELFSNIDLLPTILEAIGVEVPESIQGKSFLGLLQGRKFKPREEIFAEKTYHDIYDPIRAIRTTRFKYIRSFEKMPNLPLPSDIRRSLSARSVPEEFKGERPPVELYDLEADPDEMNNLVGGPAYAEIEKELDARLTKWLEETNDPILKGPIPAPPGAKVG
jgi:arylsulfatase A-like enzyme